MTKGEQQTYRTYINLLRIGICDHDRFYSFLTSIDIPPSKIVPLLDSEKINPIFLLPLFEKHPELRPAKDLSQVKDVPRAINAPESPKKCKKHIWRCYADSRIVFSKEEFTWHPICSTCGYVSPSPCRWFHTWDGCVCVDCGLRLPEGNRDARHTWDGCKCKKCDTKAPLGPHSWNGCVCSVCFSERHEWVIHHRSRDDSPNFDHLYYNCKLCGKEKCEVVSSSYDRDHREAQLNMLSPPASFNDNCDSIFL
jgi:hypothetical protein